MGAPPGKSRNEMGRSLHYRLRPPGRTTEGETTMTKERGRGAFPHAGALFDVGTMAGLSDPQLLERFANRRGEASELAFAALVERHGPMVLRVCRRALGDRDAAHDAFQATFLVLATKAGSLRRRESLGSWLYGVALRV